MRSTVPYRCGGELDYAFTFSFAFGAHVTESRSNSYGWPRNIATMSMSRCQRCLQKRGNESKNRSNGRLKPEANNVSDTRLTQNPVTMSFVKSTIKSIRLIIVLPGAIIRLGRTARFQDWGGMIEALPMR